MILNSPMLRDGTPMPTSYWLVASSDCRRVGRLESVGGVRRAEAEVDQEALRCAHDTYRQERDRHLERLPNDLLALSTARPSGGVGGTRRGVKCLHAHFAWFLAGGDDPVGLWVAQELDTDAQVEMDG